MNIRTFNTKVGLTIKCPQFVQRFSSFHPSNLYKPFFGLLLSFLSLTTNAALLNIQMNGPGTADDVLLGINNLVVGSTTYNVLFKDGSCESLFSGCDNSFSDFDFTTSSDAAGASTSLQEAIKTLNGGFFGSNVDQIFGLSVPFRGVFTDILVPYEIVQPQPKRPPLLDAPPPPPSQSLLNYRGFTLNFTNSSTPYDRNIGTTHITRGFEVYADFTIVPVPTPHTVAIFGLGLAGLGWSRRKKA
jgi:hypothetical protein